MRISILLVLFAISINLHGQRRKQKQHFNLGASAGILISQFDGDRLFGFNKFGPTAGLNWYYIINKKNELRFDIDYINIGSVYNGETRPTSPFLSTDYTLVSVKMQGASFFMGYTVKFNENLDKLSHKYGLTAGVRISRAFQLETFSHNSSTAPLIFDENNLSKTTIGPEGRLSAYLTPQLSVNFIVFFSGNNMLSEREHKVEVLRPFYFGFTTSYTLAQNNSKKKKRKRR